MRAKETLTIAVAALGLLVSPHPALGSLVTFEFAGEVTHVRDDDGLLGGAVTVGSPFSGVYTFESTTPDSDWDLPEAGTYDDAITFLSGEVGAISFGGAGSTFVWVRKYSSVVFDLYLVGADVSLPGVTEILDFNIGLKDSTGTAFADDSLPVSPPALVEFDSTWFIFEAESERLRLGGELTALTSLVPEPGMIMLLALAAIGLGRR